MFSCYRSGCATLDTGDASENSRRVIARTLLLRLLALKRSASLATLTKIVLQPYPIYEFRIPIFSYLTSLDPGLPSFPPLESRGSSIGAGRNGATVPQHGVVPRSLRSS